MPPDTRSPRIDGNRAQAGRKKLVESFIIDTCHVFQARHIKAHVGCPNVVAFELPRLVYEEACE
jgi:hypothetical protein